MLLLLLFASHGLLSQDQKANPLAPLNMLSDKTWMIEATWADGSVFKQEITGEYKLNENLLITKTMGFINPERTLVGERSYGVRKYDEDSKSILFWEFDTFGGVTTGEIQARGKDLWYIYNYGESTIADIWEYLDDETYAFRVVQYDNAEVGNVYLKGAYKLKK